jgi:hypothetical protein
MYGVMDAYSTGSGLGAVGGSLSDDDGAVFLIRGLGSDGADGEESQKRSEETHFDD